MELDTLRELWQSNHPNGNIWIVNGKGELFDSGKQTGKFAVTYTADGKIYTYRESSIYKLAERFNLIPKTSDDCLTECDNCINAFNQGDSYTTLNGGVYDTVSHVYAKRNGEKYLDIKVETSYDKYDRQISKLTLLGIYENYNEYAKVKGW